jgi:transcriptional regulator with XRE-family HTH domain
MSSADFPETTGQRLKRLRLERGLSQRELASQGVSYAYISRIEAGTRQPSVKALRRLAAKLGVTAEYLETGSDIRDVDARELRLLDAELALRLEHSDAAEARLEELLDEAERAGDHVSADRARVGLGFARYERGDYEGAVRVLEDVVSRSRPSERVDVFATLGRAYAAMGKPERAVVLFESCMDEVAAHDLPDRALQVRYATFLSYALSDMGDLARAEATVRDALEHAHEQDDDPYMRVRLYWSLARLSEMEGKSSAALQHIRRAIALLEATDDTIHLGRAHILCAWIMTSQGKASNALEHLDSAETLFGAHPSAEDVAMLKVERARASAALGNGNEAVRLARAAIEQLGDSQPAELGLAFWALGDGLTLQDEIDAANEAFRRAVDLLSEQKRWREATQACQSWGRMLRKAGREEQAFDVLERASGLSLHLAPATAGADR